MKTPCISKAEKNKYANKIKIKYACICMLYPFSALDVHKFRINSDRSLRLNVCQSNQGKERIKVILKNVEISGFQVKKNFHFLSKYLVLHKNLM